MKPVYNILSAFKSLAKDKAGNFATTLAFVLPVMLAATGLVLDTSYILAMKSRLRAAADAGASAAASALLSDENMTLSEAKALALGYAKAQLDGQDPNLHDSCTKVEAQATKGYGNVMTFDVTVSLCRYASLSGFGSFVGIEDKLLSVVASAQSSTGSQNALSMYLVLDRSGSMGWDSNNAIGTETYRYRCGRRRMCRGTRTVYQKKIDALKEAVDELLTQISTADPEAKYSRMASVSYNRYMQVPADFSWGTTNVSTYVHALSAGGGTDSSDAVREAARNLTDGGEETVHSAASGQVPDKYIVFMTDGDNNYSSADTVTKRWCDDAKNAGIEIFTIAFMAPSRGEALLSYCATDANHYFDANDAEEMVAAFKYIGEKATEKMTRLTQ
jgi:Flp pilus assembly protein TadG/uncharacterized protein YegL